MNSISRFWDSSFVPTLVDYIRIPAKSPHFDMFIEVPVTGGAASTPSQAGTALLYGHLNKRPEMSGWAEGLGL